MRSLRHRLALQRPGLDSVRMPCEWCRRPRGKGRKASARRQLRTECVATKRTAGGVIALLASDSLSVRKRVVQPSAQYGLKALESSATVVQSACDRTGAKAGLLGYQQGTTGIAPVALPAVERQPGSGARLRRSVHRGTQVGLRGQVRGVIEHIEKRMKELQAEKQELAEFQELDKVRNCLLTLWPIRSAIPAHFLHKSTLHPQASQARASSRPFIGSFRCAVVHWTRHGRAGPGWAGHMYVCRSQVRCRSDAA